MGRHDAVMTECMPWVLSELGCGLTLHSRTILAAVFWLVIVTTLVPMKLILKNDILLNIDHIT